MFTIHFGKGGKMKTKAEIRTMFVLAVLGLLVLSVPALAAELHVPGTYGTIQEAIDASVNGDVIIVADDIYTGPNNKNLDFAGRAITLMSENGPDNCIIDCEGSGRGFIFQNGEDENSVVDGFTISNGRAVNGGGIRCLYSSPTIVNCILRDNSTSGHGGGIYFKSSQGQIVNCKFLNNSATDSFSNGGAMILYYSEVVIKNCLFIANRCPTNGAGAIMRNWESAPTLINCTFSANSSYFAPIDNNPDSRPVFINCIFWGNPSSRTIWSHNGSCATLVFCDVEGGWNGPKVSGCVIDGGGNINADPMFVSGPLGDYYLSQTAAGQASDSACFDSGNDFAENLGLDEFTTRTDGLSDLGIVDMGYHYPTERARITITVDIKPGSCPNPLNVKSKGVLFA